MTAATVNRLAITSAPSARLERWRIVPGFPIYEVSDLGNVRSIPRVVKGRRYGGPLKFSRMNGYPSVTLHAQGAARTFKVHVLVLAAFRGARPPGSDGCHNNGHKTDNRLENLRWDSRKANRADDIRHGRANAPRGADAHSAKLTEAQIDRIFQAAAAGELQREIGSRFGVTQSAISKILRGKAWRHLRQRNGP